MPQHDDLHGAVPDTAPVALLIIDMLGKSAAESYRKAPGQMQDVTTRIARLRERASQQGFPTLFVNDNMGRWRSAGEGITAFLAYDEHNRSRYEPLAPRHEDYLILKPRHSGFFATPLHILLERMKVRALILTGATAHQCILFTAIDAYVRQFTLYIPLDCVLAPTRRQLQLATGIYTESLNADVRPSADLRMPTLKRRH